jgi:hypothetical protein
MGKQKSVIIDWDLTINYVLGIYITTLAKTDSFKSAVGHHDSPFFSG